MSTQYASQLACRNFDFYSDIMGKYNLVFHVSYMPVHFRCNVVLLFAHFRQRRYCCSSLNQILFLITISLSNKSRVDDILETNINVAAEMVYSLVLGGEERAGCFA